LCAISRFQTCVDLLVRLVEVLGCIVRAAEGGAIEVVEHQVHIFCLLILKVVADFDIPVHLDFDVGVRLA
jgi:hypothetical protein